MSGFLAVLNPGGAHHVAVDLAALTRRLEFRSSGGSDFLTVDRAVFGQADLRTPGDSGTEAGVLVLEERYYCVGSVRLNARRDVCLSLGIEREEADGSLSDLGIAARAFAVWGEACVDRVDGDYAFVVWDAKRRRLFGARDRLGARQLYYVRFESALLVSNTLEVLLEHPAVSSKMDELTVADFLMFGGPVDADRTAFAQVRRIPPAHRLTFDERGLRVTRYWRFKPSLPDRKLRFRDVAAEFRDLLMTSVRDRVGQGPAGVFMSGGLDSSTVALFASHLLPPEPQGAGPRVHAHTWVIDDSATWKIDEISPARAEGEFAGLMARREGLSSDLHRAAPDQIFGGWSGDDAAPPVEPANLPFLGVAREAAQAMARHARVGLTGQGGDPALMTANRRVWHDLRTFHWLRCARGFAQHLWLTHRLPLLGIRGRLARLWGRAPSPHQIPPWFDPDYLRRNGLTERWAEWAGTEGPPGAPETSPRETGRPEAFSNLQSPLWPLVMWTLDEEVTRQPLWVRHPFLDLRVLDFVLRLPPLPWFAGKLLLREAASGFLPEEVRLRPKSVDRFDIGLRALMALSQAKRNDHARALDVLHGIVRVPALQRLALQPEILTSRETHLLTRPMALAYWASHWATR